MAKHNNTTIYPYDNNVTLNDSLLGFDPENARRTKNYRIAAITSLIIQTIGIAVGNRKLTGNVIWLQDLDYEANNLAYIIAGNIYTAPNTIVTLSPADPTFDRFDLIYADINGEVGVLEGQASANPVSPSLDDSTQVLYAFVLVEAGTTEPTDVEEIIIYTENLITDWQGTTDNDGAVVFDSEIEANSGTVSVNVKSLLTGERLWFSQAGVNYNGNALLHFYIKKLPTAGDNDIELRIYFVDGNDVLTEAVFLNNNAFGFDNNNTEDFQSIVIPMSNFTGITTITRLFFQISGSDANTFILDDIRIVSGVNNQPNLGTFLSLLDVFESSYIGKAGYKPVVNASETGMVLSAGTVLQSFTATANQTDFPIPGSPATLALVLTSRTAPIPDADYTYEDGILSFEEGLIVGTLVRVFADLETLPVNPFPKEEDIIGTVIEPTVTAGAYTFLGTDGSMYIITITESTVFSPPTLDNSTAIAFTAIVNGDFPLSLPDFTITPTSDVYAGAVKNRLIFDCYKLSSGVQVNNVSIENLAT